MDPEEPAGTFQQETIPIESYQNLRLMMSNLRAQISATIKNAEDRDQDYSNRMDLNSHKMEVPAPDCSDLQAPPASGLIGDMDGPCNLSRPPDSPDRDLQLPLFQQVHPGF